MPRMKLRLIFKLNLQHYFVLVGWFGLCVCIFVLSYTTALSFSNYSTLPDNKGTFSCYEKLWGRLINCLLPYPWFTSLSVFQQHPSDENQVGGQII